jgi:hypothetical protein
MVCDEETPIFDALLAEFLGIPPHRASPYMYVPGQLTDSTTVDSVPEAAAGEEPEAEDHGEEAADEEPPGTDGGT